MLRGLIGHRGQRALARKMHISDVYLSEVVRGIKSPGPKILRYLGLERIEGPVTYRQKPPRQKKLPREPASTEAAPMS